MQYNVSLCNGDSGNNHLKSFNVDISRILLGLGTFLHVSRCGSWPLYLFQVSMDYAGEGLFHHGETFVMIPVVRWSPAHPCLEFSIQSQNEYMYCLLTHGIERYPITKGTLPWWKKRKVFLKPMRSFWYHIKVVIVLICNFGNKFSLSRHESWGQTEAYNTSRRGVSFSIFSFYDWDSGMRVFRFSSEIRFFYNQNLWLMRSIQIC